MPDSLKIVIAEPNEHFQSSLESIIEKEALAQCAAFAANGQQLLALTKTHKPDIIITEIEDLQVNGIEAISTIAGQQPATGIIALSSWTSGEKILQAREAGATAIVCKQSPRDKVAEAIQAVLTNKEYYCSRVAALLDEWLKKSKLHPGKCLKKPLDNEEKIVLELLSQGKQYAEIASLIGKKTRSIEDIKARIILKISLENFTKCMFKAVELGVIPFPK